VLYARLDKVDLTKNVPVEDRPEIDRWALALLHETVTKVTGALDHFGRQDGG
jgi:isoleucyl-tRNA synthetase